MANGKAQNVRIEGGWSEDREQYNIVRGKAIAGAATTPFLYGSDSGVLESIFSTTGWICTNATAQADIDALGDWPLSPNVCGVANNNTLDTINPFGSSGVGEGAATTTTALYSDGLVKIHVASSGGSGIPTGAVQVVVAPPAAAGQTAGAATFTGTAALDSNGEASVSVPAGVVGNHLVDVPYLPTHFGAANSADGHAVLGSSYTEFSHNFTGGGSVTPKVTVTVKKAGSSFAIKVKTNATGKVKVTVAGKTYKAAITAGKATVKVPASKLKKGTNTATVSVKGAKTTVTLNN